jgi:hypothetical protein
VVAASKYQDVSCRYNIEDADNKYGYIFGNGNSDTDRRNAHTLDWSGNAWFAGKVTAGADPAADMDLVTLHHLNNVIGDIDSALDSIIAIQEELINNGGGGGSEENTCPNCGEIIGDGPCPNDCHEMESTFYVDGTPYTFHIPMTWEEFINSGYNKMVSCEGCGSEHKQFSQHDDQVFYFTGDCSGIADVPIYCEYPDDPPRYITPSDDIESECEYRW